MAPLADLVNHRLFDRGGTALELANGSNMAGTGQNGQNSQNGQTDTERGRQAVEHVHGGEYEFRLYSGHNYERGEEIFISVRTCLECVHACMHVSAIVVVLRRADVHTTVCVCYHVCMYPCDRGVSIFTPCVCVCVCL